MRLLLARHIAKITFHRFDDEPPLRLLPHLAQCQELVARRLRKPKADLRIILDALSAIARRRTPDSPGGGITFRRTRFTHFWFVLATTFDKMKSQMATRTPRRTIARPRAKRGRPRTHREAWTKVSVVMFERQVLELDRLTAAIRGNTGANLTRAEIIRALLDALNESRLDVTSVVSGAQLKRLLSQKLSA